MALGSLVRLLQAGSAALLPAMALAACGGAVSQKVDSPAGGQEDMWLNGEPTREPAHPMPQLDWPPPKWTVQHEIPRNVLVVPGAHVLGDYFAGVRRMLARANGLDGSVFALGDNGFAVVSRLESIHDDGAPLSGNERYCLDRTEWFRYGFSLRRYLDSLLGLSPGRFRMFVILVTPRTVAPAPAAMSWPSALSHYARGAASLPASLAQVPAPADTHVVVLVYEFQRESLAQKEARFVESSAISAVDHLVRAGLLAKEQASP
jgi:hypothetical protein